MSALPLHSRRAHCCCADVTTLCVVLQEEEARRQAELKEIMAENQRKIEEAQRKAVS